MWNFAAVVVLAFLGTAMAGPVHTELAVPALPTSKPMLGYVTFAAFWCDTFLCPDWELDITRFDTEFRAKDMSQKLSVLLPSTPIADMNFQVLTSYDQTNRVYYVAGAQHPGGSILWMATIDDNVSTAKPIGTPRVFMYPSASDTLSRMHYIAGNANGELLTVYTSGNIYVLNVTTLKSTLVGSNILATNAALQGGYVTQSSDVDVDGNMFYTIATTSIVHNKSTGYLVSLDLSSGATTASLLKLKEMDWAGENFFNAVWIPDQGAMVVFAQAGGPTGIEAFDCIFHVTPTATATWIYNNIENEGLYAFQSYPATKQDDTLQCACYDPVSKHLYFQMTQFQSADDDGDELTTMVFLDFSAKQPWIDTAISPFAFEYIGWHYIPIIGA